MAGKKFLCATEAEYELNMLTLESGAPRRMNIGDHSLVEMVG